MMMHVPGPEAQDRLSSLSDLEAFALAQKFDRPTLVIDPAIVARNYAELKSGLGGADIHYAVKANPAREIISTLTAG